MGHADSLHVPLVANITSSIVFALLDCMTIATRDASCRKGSGSGFQVSRPERSTKLTNLCMHQLGIAELEQQQNILRERRRFDALQHQLQVRDVAFTLRQFLSFLASVISDRASGSHSCRFCTSLSGQVLVVMSSWKRSRYIDVMTMLRMNSAGDIVDFPSTME